MEILGIVSALAPDHAGHVPHEQLESGADSVNVKCGCSVKLTFLATEIAKLESAEKAKIAFTGVVVDSTGGRVLAQSLMKGGE